MPDTTLTARWLFPVSGPPLPRGTITFDGGTITAVRPHGERTPDADLGNVAVIPGLVNAHTHLDLSAARGAVPPTTPDQFTDWLRAVIAFRRRSTGSTVDAVRAGLAEALRHGTTLLGDISTDGASFEILAAAPVRAVVFHEVLGVVSARYEATLASYRAWRDRTADTPDTRRAVSPHAPYTTPLLAYMSLEGEDPRLPAASHIAESPGEGEFLATQAGPFRELLESLQAWEPGRLSRTELLPLMLLGRAARSLVVHGNYLPAEYARYFTPTMTLVVCPRTHATFGHQRHPWPDFAAAGVRVAVGTDSLASNPDLDPLAEARLLRKTTPAASGSALLRMVTLNGAEALGFADVCGSFQVGKSADFVAVPMPDVDDTHDPHELLLGEDHGARRCWFRGLERHAPKTPPTT